jgi:hypothetical protein
MIKPAWGKVLPTFARSGFRHRTLTRKEIAITRQPKRYLVQRNAYTTTQ